MRILAAVFACATLAGCQRGFITANPHADATVVTDPRGRVQYITEKERPPVVREPVLPEMLVECRGHVLVPAMGMILVLKGKEPPDRGEYMREERLTPPYRILPPNARVSAEQNPARLNVEIDKTGHIIGLYCG